MSASNQTKKTVTIKDVAREANVSYATVSRALSPGSSIREDTRQRVLEVCDRLGYTTNYVARSMVMRETRLLGLVLPSIDNPFMSEMAYHIECIARSLDYSIMLCSSSYDLKEEEKAINLVLGRQVDGIIIIPTARDSYPNLKKYLNKVPTVFVNENLMEAPESYVTVDNYRGTFIGAEYLMALGHKRILYFGRRSTTATHTLRAMGYQDACLQHGVEPMFFDSYTDATTITNGYEMARQLFRERQDFTAIQASTDTFALGVLQAADEYGIRIPEDISLLGFDNIRYAQLPKINLTTIEQPKAAMADVAVNILVGKIQNDFEAYSHRVLTPTLTKRSSCMPIDLSRPESEIEWRLRLSTNDVHSPFAHELPL
ncbi:LacI family transcriptional regulator [Eubacteriales bacterium OttesenSCG-928-K08]|nr:LacI family transcriptional regulator [Eubacteriales bacterium OttesenSCG-928-K08]